MKLTADPAERRALRSIGIETSNLYTGFIAPSSGSLFPAGNSSASGHGQANHGRPHHQPRGRKGAGQ